MGIILGVEEEGTLLLLSSALRISSKLTYPLWVRYFIEGKGFPIGDSYRCHVVILALLVHSFDQA